MPRTGKTNTTGRDRLAPLPTMQAHVIERAAIAIYRNDAIFLTAPNHRAKTSHRMSFGIFRDHPEAGLAFRSLPLSGNKVLNISFVHTALCFSTPCSPFSLQVRPGNRICKPFVLGLRISPRDRACPNGALIRRIERGL